MKRKRKLKPGFYWIMWEGRPIVAERVQNHEYKPPFGSVKVDHWHTPGSNECYEDFEVREILAVVRRRQEKQ